MVSSTCGIESFFGEIKRTVPIVIESSTGDISSLFRGDSILNGIHKMDGKKIIVLCSPIFK